METMSVYVEYGLISLPQGGLPGGGGNGTLTAVLDSTLGDADTVSQALEMLPCRASSWSVFFLSSDNQNRQGRWDQLLTGGPSDNHS